MENQELYRIYVVMGKGFAYVGASRNPHARFKKQVSCAMRGIAPGRRYYDHIRTLSPEERATMAVFVLDEVTGKANAAVAEERWRSWMMTTGLEVLNTRKGGGGLQSVGQRLQRSADSLRRDPYEIRQTVEELRRGGRTYRQIAAIVGVSPTTVGNMLNGIHCSVSG